MAPIFSAPKFCIVARQHVVTHDALPYAEIRSALAALEGLDPNIFKHSSINYQVFGIRPVRLTPDTEIRRPKLQCALAPELDKIAKDAE